MNQGIKIEPALKRFTLEFDAVHGSLETIYRKDMFRKNVRVQRLMFGFGIFVYLGFSFLDMALMAEHSRLFISVRFFFFLPIALLTLASSFLPLFSKYSDHILSAASGLSGAGLLFIHHIASQSGFFSYRYSIIFIIIFVQILLRLRFVWAAATSFSLILFFNFTELLNFTSPIMVFIDTNLLFFFIWLFCLVSSYVTEKSQRQQFYLVKLLEDEKEKVSNINMILDYKIEERTKELEDKNHYLEKLNKDLDYLSFHDQLTGLYNRRFFEEECLRLDVKRNLPLSIILADVNGLKLINDSFGHTAGDELLVKVAKVLLKGCRAEDIISRQGGDEFSICLPQTTKSAAQSIVRRCIRLAEEENLKGLSLSISFGLSVKENEAVNLADIFKEAEDNMYKVKLFESPSMRSNAIKVMMNTLHEKSKREEQHSQNVAQLSTALGRAIGLDPDKLRTLENAALLHDIGKIALDEALLYKNGAITSEEYDEMKKHSEIGYRILNASGDMTELAEFVLFHHERWDGKGYPKGLSGNDIPLLSRIICLADTYDAITTDSTYKPAQPVNYAFDELVNNAGKQFDPVLVEAFVQKVLKQGEQDL